MKKMTKQLNTRYNSSGHKVLKLEDPGFECQVQVDFNDYEKEAGYVFNYVLYLGPESGLTKELKQDMLKFPKKYIAGITPRVFEITEDGYRFISDKTA